MSSTSPRFSPLVHRLHNDGLSGWDVHSRAERAVASGEQGVIILSIGDPDFATPAPIVDSAIASLRNGDTHYEQMNGRAALRRAIAADTQARTGLTLDADNVVVTAGTQNGLFAASLCLLGEGDEVVALEPMYLTYESTLTVAGAKLVTVGQPAPRFRPDPAAIAAAITPATRAIAITNPNNPTGVVMTNGELEKIAQLAIEHDLWVISDEVYCDVVFDAEPGSVGSIAALPGMAERTVIVGSLSKSHAMTGWRAGWAIGPKDLMSHVHAMAVIVNYGIPGFVQHAALDALVHFKDTANEMRATYQERRDLAVSALSRTAGLDIAIPDAGMYLLIDVTAVAESSAAFCDELFDEQRVALLDAKGFGASANGWVRLSFTASTDDIAEGCRRIVEFVRARTS